MFEVLEVQQENVIIETEPVYSLPLLEGIISSSHDTL